MIDFSTYFYIIEKAITRLGLNPAKCVTGNCNWQLIKGSIKLHLSVFENRGQ